jgi:putative oxidoreductase
MHPLLSIPATGILFSTGLLLLRLLTGSFMLTHGVPKLKNFSAYAQKFPGIAGLSSKTALSLSILAELGCAILLIPGLLTRLAAILLLINMMVAFFKVHLKQTFDKKEMALLYATIFLVLAMTGAGMFSLDYLLRIP